jgi:hypothetical protein
MKRPTPLSKLRKYRITLKKVLRTNRKVTSKSGGKKK